MCSGDLQICDSITGNWHQAWARLQGFNLETWSDKRRLEDLPMTSLPITRVIFLIFFFIHSIAKNRKSIDKIKLNKTIFINIFTNPVFY